MSDQIIETLNIKNFMGIKQLNFTPQTDFIKIEGENGAGKSTIEEAISLIFMSRVDAKRIKNPVRMGEDMATVRVELSDMTITKRWSSSGKSRVEVFTKDGAKYPSPTKLIESLIGPLPHDPTRLMNQSDKEMMETLLSLIDTGGVDFNELDMQYKKVYEDRTGINRLMKNVKVKRDSHLLDFPDVPTDEISLSELSTQLTDSLATEEQHRVDIGTRKLNHESIESKKDEIERLNNEINQIIKMDDELLIKMNDYVDPDTASIQDQIRNIEEINKQTRYMKDKAVLISEYEELSKQSDNKTQELQDITDTKEYVINNANMPIKGVSFDKNGITYNGIPLGQCSTAEQLKVCIAFCVGTHPQTEHNIKVMLLHHGNNLDSKNLEYVKGFCAENGYQTWIEMVADKPSGTGVFIEGGEIKDEN